MAYKSRVSDAVVRRLPMYYRHLRELEKAGVVRISSQELGERMNLTASQIRQDINCFGGFGQQGIGYNVKLLHEELGKLIFARHPVPTILIGAGNLGHAMANYFRQDTQGFELLAAFDVKPEMIGLTLCGVAIRDMAELESYCAEHKPKVAVICVPREAAKQVAQKLIDLGIRAFWNFSHYDLAIKFDDIIVENVHLSDSLMTMCYRITNEDNPQHNNA